MTKESKIVPLEPGVKLGVRCFVQGILQGRWERLISEIGLQKNELEQIGNLFHDRQYAYNQWRWLKAEQFAAAGDTVRAAAWRQHLCILCDTTMLNTGGQLICPCYREFGVGFVQYEPVDPILHLKNWKERGGEWGEFNKPLGSPEARQYANKTCYTNDCSICGEPFFVTISEMLKVAKVIVDDPNAGGDGRYRVRRVCPGCKSGQRSVYDDRDRQNRRSHGVKHLHPPAPPVQPVKRVGGEKGGE